MSNLIFDNGANWVRVDLHLHTPGVRTFQLPSGVNIEDEQIIRELSELFVKRLVEADIKIGAITDYNGIRQKWFKTIREIAESKNIYIFPGVELSIKNFGKGLHLLIIFEYDREPEKINKFIHSLDRNPQNDLFEGRDFRDIDSQETLKDLIKKTRERFNCLIIFPHPSDDNGLMKAYRPQEAAEYLENLRPDAIEFIRRDDIQRLISTGSIKKEFFEQKAIIEGSDPHNFDEIGYKTRNGRIRATYLKLSSVSIDALKIALHDPEVRLRLYEALYSQHTFIEKITVNGSTFLKEVNATFNPGCNTLIGGRGVGKSAIIETLRYVLDLPIYAEKSTRTDFVESVIGSGGMVEVKIRKFYGNSSQIYTIRRIVGDFPEVFDEHGNLLELKSPLEIFDVENQPILIGQKELYFLANNRRFLLHLVDQLIGPHVQEKISEFDRKRKALKENVQNLLQFHRKLKEKEEIEQELKNIEAKIKIFEDLKVVEKSRRYTNLMEDESTLLNALETVIHSREILVESIEEVISELESQHSQLLKGKSELADILKNSGKTIEQIVAYLKKLSIQLASIFEQSKDEIEKNIEEFKEKKRPIEEEYLSVKKKLAEEGYKPEELEKIIRKRQDLERKLKKLESLEEEYKKLMRERETNLIKLRNLRHEIFIVRQKEVEKIKELTNQKLRISVEFETQKDLFLKELIKLFKGSGVSKSVIENMVGDPQKRIDGWTIARAVKEAENNLSVLIEQFNLTETMAKRILDWFKNYPERLYDIETLFPEDKIIIELNLDGHFKDIMELSAGQKATALLLLLFAQQNKILILDQPEEDLDNRFVYEDVVKFIRQQKETRQFIIATHNANIPVLGDSELVLVLNAEKDQCHISNRGSIDYAPIRKDIKEIMEGGEEAFQRRAEKYGGEL